MNPLSVGSMTGLHDGPGRDGAQSTSNRQTPPMKDFRVAAALAVVGAILAVVGLILASTTVYNYQQFSCGSVFSPEPVDTTFPGARDCVARVSDRRTYALLLGVPGLILLAATAL